MTAFLPCRGTFSAGEWGAVSAMISPPSIGRTSSMARITVEDCLQNEPNLFNLVLLAAKRARRLANGAEATVEWENDKPTVVALREIAAGNITLEMLEEPEQPPQPPASDLAIPSVFRAPQLDLGTSPCPPPLYTTARLCVFTTRCPP